MNILVTGANGQLGNELRLVSKGSRDRYIFTDVNEVQGAETVHLDITDREAVEDAVAGRWPVSEKIDMVINCSAYTNVDRAEDDAAVADLLNAEAPGYIADAVKKNGGFMVHVSTDYVFGGNLNNTPCREDEPANPTGVYGRTKLRGEQNITASGCRHIILRTAWLYSGFSKNFLKTMLSLTASRPELKVVFDQTGTPTYARDLARAIYEIVENRKFEGNEGIYHYSNEGVCSWYDFTKMIAEYSGHSSCNILPCHSDEFPSKVRRPSYSVLDKTKIKETFGVAVPYWTDALRECLEKIRSGEEA